MNQSSLLYVGDNGNNVTIFEEASGGGGDLRFRFEPKSLQDDPITFEFTVSGQRSYHTMCTIRNILAGKVPEGESMEYANVKRISDECEKQLLLNIGKDGVNLTGIDSVKKIEICVNIGTHAILRQTFSMVARAMMRDNKENPLIDKSMEQESSICS